MRLERKHTRELKKSTESEPCSFRNCRHHDTALLGRSAQHGEEQHREERDQTRGEGVELRECRGDRAGAHFRRLAGLA